MSRFLKIMELPSKSRVNRILSMRILYMYIQIYIYIHTSLSDYSKGSVIV